MEVVTRTLTKAADDGEEAGPKAIYQNQMLHPQHAHN